MTATQYPCLLMKILLVITGESIYDTAGGKNMAGLISYTHNTSRNCRVSPTQKILNTLRIFAQSTGCNFLPAEC
jgi:hypothetical protein